MRHTVPSSTDTLAAISCDRCGETWTADTLSASEFTSIAFTGRYDSVFGDGSQVEVDLCQQCLKQTLGQWLRVADRNYDEDALARDLKPLIWPGRVLRFWRMRQSVRNDWQPMRDRRSQVIAGNS
jgi:hypothetical protein